MRERVRRAAAVMGHVWGLEKRRFGGGWERRIWLFDRLIWLVLIYGVEIWGWKKRGRVEEIEKRGLGWLLGMERRTPGCLVKEKLQREKLQRRADRRAWRFDERRERDGKKVFRERR